ncbi:MAG: NAD-dependent epimerase [Frondihabitans sp.]|nr:NAD-dependent epimerase [Frondihabitans sp.]
MTDRIVLAGASGFIGAHLTAAFRQEGAEVVVIGRRGPDARWGDTAAITDLLDGADLLINLAGKSVNCRYTAEARREILRSRIETTNELAEALAACQTPPPLWLNSSTATIYRHAEDRPMTEATGEIGTGFSVSIATSWETAFFARDLPQTRKVALRMAIVLGDGSALMPLIGLARAGLGGAQIDGRWPATKARLAAGTYHRFGAKNGRQRFSWIHIDDVVGIVRFLRQHEEIDGIVNLASPHPSDNRSMMRDLRNALGVRIGLPLWRVLLEIGSALIGTETELVLKSRWVVPERLSRAGYEFEHPYLDETLKSIVAGRRSR